MQAQQAPTKNAATFRKKKARRIEIDIKSDILKKIALLETQKEQ